MLWLCRCQIVIIGKAPLATFFFKKKKEIKDHDKTGRIFFINKPNQQLQFQEATTLHFKMMKSALIFLVVCLACLVSADSIGCNYRTGAGSCVLPGVGPTYSCGQKAGYKNYKSDADQRYWDATYQSTSFAKFEKCCKAAGKGVCHG